MKIRQSRTHQCFVCGIENPYGLKINFESDGEGKVSAKKVFSKEYQGYPGIVHGGVLAAVLDEAAGRATMKGKRPERNLVTGRLSIRYRKPVRVGEEVVIEGYADLRAAKVQKCSSAIRSREGEILAEAEAFMVEPGQSLLEAIAIDDDQWVD